MASHAVVAMNLRLVVLTEGDGLMAAIHTRHMTTATSYTLVAVYHREDNCRTVQVAWLDKLGQLLADKLAQIIDSTLCHVVL